MLSSFLKKNDIINVYFTDRSVMLGRVVSCSNNIIKVESLKNKKQYIIKDFKYIELLENEENTICELKEDDVNLKLMNIAQLKREASKEEFIQIKKKLRSFDGNVREGVEYGFPRKLQKPPNFNSTKKD